MLLRRGAVSPATGGALRRWEIVQIGEECGRPAVSVQETLLVCRTRETILRSEECIVGVGRYILARLALTVPMLLILLTIVFLILRVIPGDPCLAMLGGRNVGPEQIQNCRVQLGVDRPIMVQYLRYLGGIIRGDLGDSIRTGLSVSSELLERFPATVELAISGMLIATLMGMATGIYAATHSDRPADHALR